MTSSLIENVQVYLLSHVVTRYCMIYVVNSSKIGICFYNKSYIKKSDVENLKNLFLLHGPFRKRIKPGVTELILFQEGLTPSP